MGLKEFFGASLYEVNYVLTQVDFPKFAVEERVFFDLRTVKLRLYYGITERVRPQAKWVLASIFCKHF